MGTLACMELVSRRLQQFIEAHALGADSPDWENGWRQSCLGAGAAAALVGGLPGGTACRGDEEKDMGGKACGPPVAKTSLVEGGRSPVHLPQNRRRLAATKRRNLSFAAASRSFCVVFWWRDQIGCIVKRTARRLVLPDLWPAKTRTNVFVSKCSSASPWRLCFGLMLTALLMRMRPWPSF